MTNDTANTLDVTALQALPESAPLPIGDGEEIGLSHCIVTCGLFSCLITDLFGTNS